MQSKRFMASVIAIPNRRNAHGRGVAEIYIGGAADGQSQLVVSYVKARQRALLEGGVGVGRTATWFAHYDMDGMLAHCRAALSQGDELVLVGHSWGSDAALRVTHQLQSPVSLLAGVDPVMRPGGMFSNMTRRPDNAGLVAHVDARPRAFDRSDIVKATGVVLGGGLVLGAFFMATDYITSPLSRKGKIIFGIGCGLMTALIRLFGGMTEGVSFSILFMNILTPQIDRWTTPVPFGGGVRRAKA